MIIEYTKKEVLSNYKTRMRDRPEYYTEHMKRIIKDVDSTEILEDEVENNIEVRDVINITREFLDSLNKEYLDVFNYMISKDNIKLIAKNKRKLEQKGIYYYDTPEIIIKFNSTDYLLHTLAHEMGHAIYKREPGYLYMDAAYNETISQLFPLLLKDFLKERYPKIDVNPEEQKQFNIVMGEFTKDWKKQINIMYKAKDSLYPFLEVGKDVWCYEKSLTYLYSYYLAHVLHEDYKNTKDFKNIIDMIRLSKSGYLETEELLEEMEIKKRIIGTKKMQKEIRSKLK